MSETIEAVSVHKLISDVAAWWDGAVLRARVEKDDVAFAKTVLSALRAEDFDDAPFLWRDTVAAENLYPACKGTVMDVADPRTEIHLPFFQLLVASKTLVRLSENHCLGMEELWDRYRMSPPKTLTKEACLQWIDNLLKDAPEILQRAIDAAAKGEGLLPAAREAADPTVE